MLSEFGLPWELLVGFPFVIVQGVLWYIGALAPSIPLISLCLVILPRRLSFAAIGLVVFILQLFK